MNWTVHVSIVKDNADNYGYASFKTFKKHFDSVKWEKTSGGIWDETLQTRYMHTLLMFNGVGMIINNPISYIRAQLYIRNHMKKKLHKW